MPPEDPKEPPTLTALSSTSLDSLPLSWQEKAEREIAHLTEMLPRLLGMLPTIAAMQEDDRRQWTRAIQLSKLVGQKYDHVLKLAGAVEHDANSRDRQTEAVLILTQRLTAFLETLEYVKAGLDEMLKRGAKKTRGGGGEGGGDRVNIVYRTILVIVKAPFRSQVMLLLFALTALCAFGIRQWGEKQEASQGLPIDEYRRRHPDWARERDREHEREMERTRGEEAPRERASALPPPAAVVPAGLLLPAASARPAADPVPR